MVAIDDIKDIEGLRAAYLALPEIKSEFDRKFMESDLQSKADELGLTEKYEDLKRTKQNITPTPTICNIRNADYVMPPGYVVDPSGAIRKSVGTEDNIRYDEIISHPIAIKAKAKNIDSNHTKLLVVWERGNETHESFFSAKTLSCRDIIDLSLQDIDVTTANANKLIQFLQKYQKFNEGNIEKIKSVGRCGWLKTDAEKHATEIFSPYSEKMLFDGRDEVGSLFDAINEQNGDMETWLEGVKKARKNPVVKTVIAASLASVLIKKVGGLPFILHLWGGTGVGKTVALHLASSVWGERNEYTKNFNSTKIGMEQVCAFLNNLPLVMDELQIKKNARDFDNLIYSLTQGSGRTRGKREGGFQNAQTWKNVIITSGEAPISKAHSGGGALNRVIEIQCDDVLFEDFDDITNMIDENYGVFGREYVKAVQRIPVSDLKKTYANTVEHFKNKGLAEKQYRSAAMILLADKILVETFLKDGSYIGMAFIEQYIKKLEDVDANLKGYQYLRDVITANHDKFTGADRECWGAEDINFVYMIRSYFNKVLTQEGYDPQALISWLKANGKIDVGEKNTKTKRINGKATRCVWLKHEPDDFIEETEDEGVTPF